MVGYVEWGVEKTMACGEAMVCGLRVVRLRLGRESRFRAVRGARALQRQDVERAIFPEGFPYGAAFEKRGIRAVDVLPLRRQLAAQAVARVMEEMGLGSAGAVIAVTGSYLSSGVERTVTELCLRNRYVMLAVPGGAEGLCRRLQREYGVSVLQHPSDEQLGRADILVRFDGGKEAPARRVIDLAGGSRERWELGLPEQLKIPDGCCREQLAAALAAAGVLRPGQIEVKSLYSNA